MGGDRLMQPTWQGNQFQFQRATPPAIPAYTYTPEPPQVPSLFRDQVVNNGLLGLSGGNAAQQNNEPESVQQGLTAGNNLGHLGTLGTLATGVPGLGMLGAALGSAHAADVGNAFMSKRGGLNDEVSPWDAFVNNISFGLLGNNPTAQVNNALQSLSTVPDGTMAPEPPGLFGTGMHPGENPFDNPAFGPSGGSSNGNAAGGHGDAITW